MYDFYLNKNLINDFIVEVSYSENLEDVGTSFGFTSKENFGITSEINGKKTINCFEICPKNTRNAVYLGFITDTEHTKDVDVYKYSGFDVGFYLKNNQVVKKLNGNIGTAIKNLCSEYQINLNDLPTFKQNIKKIYKGEAFDEILKELLELEKTKGGLKDVYIDCKNGGLNIRQYQTEESLIVPVAQALTVNGLNTFNNVTVKNSVQKLRNKIIVTDNANDKIALYKPKQDKDSIATYGLLTHVEKIDTNKKNDIPKLLEDKLAELNRVEEKIDLSIIGDYRAGKGKIIPVNLEEYGLTDSFLILSANHKIYENREEIELSLKRYNEKTI